MAIATGAAVGLFGLLLFSTFLWIDLRERLELRELLSQAKDHAVLLGTSVDYITLIRPDPVALSAMKEEVAKLDLLLGDIGPDAVYEARAHLREIGYIVNLLVEAGPETRVDRDVAGQLSLHQTRVQNVLQYLSDTEDERYLQSLLQSTGWLLACSVLICLVSFAGFAWMYRRLKPPMRVLGATIGKLAGGDLSARTGLDTDDELGKLGRDIDAMAMRRQRDEDALRESEERFRQLTENINEIFWLKEIEGSRLLYISPSYETIFGLSLESAHEKPSSWLKALHPEDCDAVAESLARQAPDRYELTYRIIRPDGEIRWLLDRAFPVRDADGEVRRVAGLAEDVTREMVAQNALKERVKELRCLYTAVELTSRTDLTLPEICQRICDRIPESLLYDRDAEARIAIGDERYESQPWQPPAATLDATIEMGGQPVGTLTAGYLSEHPDQPDGEGPFLAEERALLNSIAAHLGKLLEKLRLEQGLQRANRLEAVGQLTGGVAHDFNNLLTVIMGSAELLLLRSNAPPTEHDPAAMILSAAERGAELVRQMLAFARRQPLVPEPVNLNQLVEDMRPLLARTVGEGIGIDVRTDGSDCVAMVDRAQMESALLNLVLNSRDAMGGGGQVSIETGSVTLNPERLEQTAELAPGRYARLAVRDTGSGMSAEELTRAFEPFFTTKEAGKGSGLGLSMVYGFAKQSRGHVELHSTPGKGTTVEIYLPCCDGATKRPEGASPTTIPGKGERILLVEDNDHVREFARQQLESLGYVVIEARDGNQALEWLKGHADIDLLFTDFVMPGGMNGQELVDAARAIYPNLKVLMTSGYADIAESPSTDASFARNLLPKPYKLSELSARLSRALYDVAD